MATTKRDIQRRQILDQVYMTGQISRIDLAHACGITPAITTSLVKELIAEGTLSESGETGPRHTGSGRPRILLTLVPSRQYFVGSELSYKFFSFCLVDNVGTIIKTQTIPIAPGREELMITADQYGAHLRDFLTQCADYHPQALGIALPGHYNRDVGNISSSETIWKSFNLPKIIAEAGLPVYLENNVHCMATAERLTGASRPGPDFAYIHFSLGIFASYTHNGQLYGADNYLVGEIGHTIVYPNGQLCLCGRRGCLQAYASEDAILRKARLLMRGSRQSFLRQLRSDSRELTITDVLRAYEMGDEGVGDILDTALKTVAQTLNNLSIILSAKQMILHGQMFERCGLRKLLMRYTAENQFLINGTTPPPVRIAPYHVTDGARGAAVYALDQQLLQ